MENIQEHQVSHSYTIEGASIFSHRKGILQGFKALNCKQSQVCESAF